MRTIYRFIFILNVSISILLFNSCEQTIAFTFEDWLQKNYSENIYLNTVKERFSENDDFEICYDQFEYFDTLKYFYTSRKYSPIWTKELVFNNQIDTILSFYSDAFNHGLDSNIFDASLIRYYKNLFIQKAKSDSIIDYKVLANIELLISNSLLSYSNAMQCGIINPKEIFSKNYYLPTNEIDSANYFLPLKVLDIGVYFRDILPQTKRYIALQKSLSQYRKLELYSGWDSIIYDDEEIKIEIGDSSKLLNLIAKRLKVTAELDTSYNDSITGIYDSTLFKSVVIFQKRHGLLSDGVIGKRTIKQMNVSAKDRVKQICITLERFRWFNYPDTGRYVMVNIPSYHLYAYDNESHVLGMRVCVGSKREKNYTEKLKRYIKTKNKKLKPNNHETPCMCGKLSYFVINPRWLVPRSIGEKEIIYKLMRDSLYLQNQGIRVLLEGEEQCPDSVRWSKYIGKTLPYRFRQEPGVMNALGKIKFIFKNKFDIYLHDTPSQNRFKSSFRAVSHGCVRIYHPLEFADFLLKKDDKLELDDIRMKLGMKPIDDSDEKKFKKRKKEYKERQEEIAEMDEPPALKTKTIFIKENINVYIDYFTAWVDSLGVTQFRQDVYDRDKHIWNKMNE